MEKEYKNIENANIENANINEAMALLKMILS